MYLQPDVRHIDLTTLQTFVELVELIGTVVIRWSCRCHEYFHSEIGLKRGTDFKEDLRAVQYRICRAEVFELDYFLQRLS